MTPICRPERNLSVSLGRFGVVGQQQNHPPLCPIEFRLGCFGQGGMAILMGCRHVSGATQYVQFPYNRFGGPICVYSDFGRRKVR